MMITEISDEGVELDRYGDTAFIGKFSDGSYGLSVVQHEDRGEGGKTTSSAFIFADKEELEEFLDTALAALVWAK